MLSLPDHLTHIVATIRAVIRMLTPSVPARDPREPMFHRLFNRVGRAARLFARLHALWQQNRVPAPRPSRAGQPRPADPAPPPAAIPPIPRGRGWLVRLGQHHGALAHTRLEAFLQRDDLPAFLAAVPRAGRYLRPLCRLLAVPLPEFLALPPRPRKPRPSRPRANRPPSLRNPHLEPGDQPYRPYVLAAARYWGKKYGWQPA